MTRAPDHRDAADAPYTGGCACGAIRYSIIGKPAAMIECHCLDCQKDSGTGHASHVVFRGADVAMTGIPVQWGMTADSGEPKSRGFCATCGTPVTLTFPRRPEVFSVRAASLDQPDRYAPQVVVYTDRRPAWDRVDASLPSFAGMPPR
jgi:hypothetical protein